MLEKPGKLLKAKRDELGLALADVSKSTLIRPSILQALENDDTEIFSSPAQHKGFLRNYARFLKLNLTEVLEELPTATLQTEIVPESEIQTADSFDEKTSPASIQQAVPVIVDENSGILLNSSSNAKESISVFSSESQIIFSQIGGFLIERRNLLSFSLENVSQIIHIKENYLQALEVGDLDKFASPIQFKGALQNYAQFLGIDTARLLLLFAEGLQKKREEQSEGNTGQRTAAKKIPPGLLQIYKFFTLDLMFGVFLIVGILAFLIWGTSRMIQTSQQGKDIPTLPAVSDVLNATTIYDQDDVLTPISDLVTQEEPEIQVTNTLILPIEIYNSPIQVLIVFNQSVWIRVIGDGKNIFEGRIDAGDAQTFTAEQSMFLTIANAAGIQVYYKGVDLGAIGPLGKVVTLAFDSNGLIKATPTPTRTPTPTIQVTQTATQENPQNSP